MSWTPQEKRRIKTIENMMIFLLTDQRVDIVEGMTDNDVRKRFEPPLEPIPDIINPDKSAMAERMLKVTDDIYELEQCHQKKRRLLDLELKALLISISHKENNKIDDNCLECDCDMTQECECEPQCKWCS